jgi:molecular chaperone GrpE
MPMNDERKPVHPEFSIDEEPENFVRVKPAREALVGVMQRAYQLQRHLTERNANQQGDLLKQSDFLRKLLRAKEDRCDRLLSAERERQGDSLDSSPEVREETAKWLRRVELIQTAIDRVLESYGVTRYLPTGRASPEREDIQGTVRSPGVEPGAIVEVLEPGYLWRGELLRPARVMVAE